LIERQPGRRLSAGLHRGNRCEENRQDVTSCATCQARSLPLPLHGHLWSSPSIRRKRLSVPPTKELCTGPVFVSPGDARRIRRKPSSAPPLRRGDTGGSSLQAAWRPTPPCSTRSARPL